MPSANPLSTPPSAAGQNWLAARTAATPDAPALIIGDAHWRYADLSQLVDALAAQLSPHLRPGQIAGVLMPNTLGYVCLIHALARLRVVLLPLNTRLTPAELAWQLTDAQCAALIVEENLGGVGLDLARESHCPLVTVSSELSIEVTAMPEVTVDQSQQASDHSLQAIVYTSGTTGRPKGAMLTFDNHFYSALASAYRLGVQPDDLWLSCLPLYHVGGLAVIWRSCLYGTAVSLHQRFVLEEVNRDLDANPITLISVVPTMLQRLVDSRNGWPATLRLILLGGAAATPELVAAANKLPRARPLPKQPLPLDDPPAAIDPPPLVATTYGLTEAASQVATMLPRDVAAKPGSVGKPLLFTRVRVIDDHGRDLPPNQVGEIIVSGPSVMAGYFQRPDATAETVRDGELFTGDMGYLDDGGDLWLVDRRSDIIVSGGENVYPAEVEAVLRAHPGVTAVCVAGVRDATWGQRVAAMIVPADDGLTADALIAHARTHLAGYKIPRQIRFVDALPLTASGKIARSQVRTQLESSEDGANQQPDPMPSKE